MSGIPRIAGIRIGELRSLRKAGLDLKFLRPVYLHDKQELAFYPGRLTGNLLTEKIRTGFIAKEVLPKLSLEEYCSRLEKDYGKKIADLARLGGIPLFQGGGPATLSPDKKNDLLAVSRHFPKQQIVYLMEEQFYVLVPATEDKLLTASGDSSFSIKIAPTQTEYKIPVFQKTDPLIKFFDPFAETAPAPAQATGPAVDLKPVILPAAAKIGGQTGEVSVNTAFFGLSELGKVRTSNQDSFLIDPDRRLLLVADGMGGHKGGEVASEMAIRTVYADLTRKQPLEAAIPHANELILEAGNTDEAKKGMGTTIVAAQITGNNARIAHVGDSQAYIIKKDGTLQLLTIDHAGQLLFLQEAFRQPELWPVENSVPFNYLRTKFSQGITPPLEVADILALEDAFGEIKDYKRAHPDVILHTFLQKNIIVKALGLNGTKPTIIDVPLEAGDCLLLCTDGLNGALNKELMTVIADHPPQGNLREAALFLKQAVYAGKAGDNVTIVLYEHHAVEVDLSRTINIPLEKAFIDGFKEMSADETKLIGLMDRIIDEIVEIPSVSAAKELIPLLQELVDRHSNSRVKDLAADLAMQIAKILEAEKA